MKILIVVDVQNDFIDGSLGSQDAVDKVPGIVNKIKEYKDELILITKDTHNNDYLNTLEGKNLPVKHCIKNTDGWEINPNIKRALKNVKNIKEFEKGTFGSIKLRDEILKLSKKGKLDIEMVGFCTDICIISNALLIKSILNDDINISVNEKLTSGVSKEKHDAAIEVMKSCQINIK